MEVFYRDHGGIWGIGGWLRGFLNGEKVSKGFGILMGVRGFEWFMRNMKFFCLLFFMVIKRIVNL